MWGTRGEPERLLYRLLQSGDPIAGAAGESVGVGPLAAAAPLCLGETQVGASLGPMRGESPNCALNCELLPRLSGRLRTQPSSRARGTWGRRCCGKRKMGRLSFPIKSGARRRSGRRDQGDSVGASPASASAMIWIADPRRLRLMPAGVRDALRSRTTAVQSLSRASCNERCLEPPGAGDGFAYLPSSPASPRFRRTAAGFRFSGRRWPGSARNVMLWCAQIDFLTPAGGVRQWEGIVEAETAEEASEIAMRQFRRFPVRGLTCPR